MGKIIDRHRERMTRQTSDWKDSKLVIAALAVAGTATFMSTVVMPVTTASLTAKLEELAPADEKIKRLEKDLAESKSALIYAKALAEEATVRTPFLPGSVYPVGLDRVHIGSSLQQVVEIYPNGTWSDDDYVSIDTGHKIFSRVTYYFNGKKENRLVTRILFHIDMQSPLKRDTIKNRFSILFGPPTATGRKGEVWWKATPREAIEIDFRDSYSVSSSQLTPYWVNR